MHNVERYISTSNPDTNHDTIHVTKWSFVETVSMGESTQKSKHEEKTSKST